MNAIYAVLLEISSIQQYVFGSNKLKENLGASHLVENVFDENLKRALEIQIPGFKGFDSWKNNPQRIGIFDRAAEVEIGYIGGGNALLFFKKKDKAVNTGKEWSKDLLINAPGLRPSIAIDEVDCSSLDDKEKFPVAIRELFDKLRENKLNYQPQTTFPRHGITAECHHTGLSAEFFDEKSNSYVSSVSMKKMESSQAATDKLHEKFSSVLKGYCFPTELNDLGQTEGDSHISIAHIDGNRMGSRFQECKTLEEIRLLSIRVKKATEDSFANLLKLIVQKIEHDNNIFDYFNFNGGLLPIRPIIMGGDDITFVSPGKLGIYFAEIFMKEFSEKKVSDEKKLSSCAGVAITKTKYPFYRGYRLAEGLCGNAKKMAYKETDSSWIDFHIAYGGFSGSIENIRRTNYTGSCGNLCLRPYRVIGKVDYCSLSECISGINQLSGLKFDPEEKSWFDFDESKWPRSKLKEFREVLTMGASVSERFIKEMGYRHRTLPDVKGYPECKNTGWICDRREIGSKVTPYFDMLELMEIYPLKLLLREEDI
ncbi:Cas10/Cmr2 second palm domain-containing protein [Methanosarcina sp.]|uniref:Cas10/Cmr2 second palm domain-containing protein n=1 Tax=Methanosarcina sp. TaxID=2213 RepID=UPI0029890F56|nr:hypothetical protein [Methanosarcina sp.]MDW5550412.1 hypothetical protein [Methanosarcina sp.]MDW5554736.1 hypothetical protein [Methanosarcina sp.]MDW5559965.1 hypothetical protein [Methanosarcina sp.]